MVEAEIWLKKQPKNTKGKVDIRLVIEEGKKRGYCICPKPMRQMINMNGMICALCLMPESKESWKFWYAAYTIS
jgi:hypothetical protein